MAQVGSRWIWSLLADEEIVRWSSQYGMMIVGFITTIRVKVRTERCLSQIIAATHTSLGVMRRF